MDYVLKYEIEKFIKSEKIKNYFDNNKINVRKLKKDFFVFKNLSNKIIEKYFFDFLNTQKNNFCEISKKEKIFLNFKKGYSNFCEKNTKTCLCYKNFLKEKSIENFGYNNEEKRKNIKEKIEKTMIERYGVINPSKNKDIVEKRKNNNILKYGKTTNLLFQEIKSKIKQNNLKNYGCEYIFQNKELLQKAKNEFYKKYGVENPFLLDEIKEKAKIKIKEKYNVDNISLLKTKRIENFLYDKNWLTNEYVKNKKTSEKISKELNVAKSTVCNQLKKFNIKIKRSSISEKQKEIFDFIKKCYDFEILLSKRKIIFPYELDIFMPQKNIAIEYCGLYWHREDKLGKDYHVNKLNLCLSKEIKLITLFSNEWIYDNENTRNKILWILNGEEYRLYEKEIGNEEILVDRRWTEGKFLLDRGYELIETLEPKKLFLDKSCLKIEKNTINSKNFVFDCGYYLYKKIKF